MNKRMKYLHEHGVFKPECIIYLLLNKGKVRYVGQSIYGLTRVKQHLLQKEKVFDDYKIIKCKKEELNDMENYYILKYNPIYNLRLNTNMVGVNYMRDQLLLHFEYTVYGEKFLSNILKNIKTDYVVYRGKKRIHINLANKIIKELIEYAENTMNKY